MQTTRERKELSRRNRKRKGREWERASPAEDRGPRALSWSVQLSSGDAAARKPEQTSRFLPIAVEEGALCCSTRFLHLIGKQATGEDKSLFSP